MVKMFRGGNLYYIFYKLYYNTLSSLLRRIFLNQLQLQLQQLNGKIYYKERDIMEDKWGWGLW